MDSPFDPDRVLQALRETGFAPIPERPGWIESVARACETVVAVVGEPVPTWDVGDHRVRHAGGDRTPVGPRTMVCSCAGRTCGHVASVLVVLAFADPVRGAALRAPAWEVALGPLAPRPGPRLVPRPGPIRYELRPPVPGISGLVVVATAPGGRYPRTVEALRAELADLTEADVALHPALHALERARKLERSGRPETTRHLSRSLLPLLARVQLLVDGDPVRVATAPVRPRLKATRRPDGGLAVGWVPPLRLHWRDAGVVLTADGTLAPLPDDLSEAVAERLSDPVPPIPRADVERFVDRLVVARGLDVELPPDLPVVRDPDGRRARLTLEEVDGETLEVRLERIYRRGDGEGTAPDTDEPTLLVPGEGRVYRDLAWEAAERARFAAEEIGPPSTADAVRLVGEDALDFLFDVLPALAERWEVYGRDRLARMRVAGAAQPYVRFADHEDWFDLDVKFTVGGRSLDPRPVIASWRRGLRYHRLDDGAVARLPREWLARHAERVDLLAEVRRAQGKLGSWHAWMASELLAEVGEGQRWLAAVRALAEGVPEGAPPLGLRATLRPYQQRGLDWLRFLREHGLHGLLADEMGLGKTVQALAVLAESHARPGMEPAGSGPRCAPSLVVAPTSVVHNWRDEAARFAPDLRVCVWTGPRRDRAALASADLVLTSYALLRRDRVLLEQPWTWVVLDEAQQIKNPGSRGARAARRLVAKHRLALTGTPLENDLTELWSVMSFLLPGLLGRRTSFHARYSVAGRLRPQNHSATAAPPAEGDIVAVSVARCLGDAAEHGDESSGTPDRGRVSRTMANPPASGTPWNPRGSLAGLDELGDRIRPFVLRRRKAEVAPELPPRTEVTLRVELSDGERRLYDAVRNTVREALLDGERVGSVLLDGLTRLRQACCHPALLPFPEARRVQRSSKLEVLLERIGEAVAQGSRCLVFSQWVRLLDEVSRALAARDLDHLRLQGDTVDRAAVVRAFQDPAGPPVMLVSLKAGGTGLNLTAADVVFHLDPWWNPAAEDQATDRAHRIGQPRPVTVVRLVAADTVEDRVLALQARKRLLFDETVGRAPTEPLTSEELRELIGGPTR